MTKTTLLFALLAASLPFTACQKADPKPSEASPLSHTPEAGDGADHGEESEASSVEFEPAYPTEVSPEGLSTEDIAQQEEQHSHADGKPHSHDGAVDGQEADSDDADHHDEEGTDDNHDH